MGHDIKRLLKPTDQGGHNRSTSASDSATEDQSPVHLREREMRLY